jgi:hypothetical protein
MPALRWQRRHLSAIKDNTLWVEYKSYIKKPPKFYHSRGFGNLGQAEVGTFTDRH